MGLGFRAQQRRSCCDCVQDAAAACQGDDDDGDLQSDAGSDDGYGDDGDDVSSFHGVIYCSPEPYAPKLNTIKLKPWSNN